jgi:hypothetical protein
MARGMMRVRLALIILFPLFRAFDKLETPSLTVGLPLFDFTAAPSCVDNRAARDTA